jgi:aryl carrier-like protein
MQRGSVRALLNVLPDPTGRDARSAMALAEQLVKQGADAASLLRLRGVTKTVRLIEITAPGMRKHTTLQDWRALLPSSAPKTLVEILKRHFPIRFTVRIDDSADLCEFDITCCIYIDLPAPLLSGSAISATAPG